jgi:hypothetical protein
MRERLLLGLIGIFLSPSMVLAAPAFREDLRKASAHYCGESNAPLKDFGIYDAQLELAFVKDVTDPEAFARDFAQSNQHRGFSFGSCTDKRQWIVSSPSPRAVLQIKSAKKSLHIDLEALTKVCGSYDVDGIKNGVESPVSIVKARNPRVKNSDIPFKQEEYSSLSLTCHPLDKGKEGPELWAFAAFSLSKIIANLKSEDDFRSWIAELRLRNNLPSLATGNSSLQALADESSAVTDLRHPRELLLKKKSELSLMKIEILGENRASASTFKGLAELLWNSPSHRRLLLHPLANQIALKTRDKGHEKLLVMVLARK